jgi:hypothetical protein
VSDYNVHVTPTRSVYPDSRVEWIVWDLKAVIAVQMAVYKPPSLKDLDGLNVV